MGEQVFQVIAECIVNESNMNMEQAKAYINEMINISRFHQDVFGNSLAIKNECSSLELSNRNE